MKSSRRKRKKKKKRHCIFKSWKVHCHARIPTSSVERFLVFVGIFTLFMHCSPNLGEHSYTHCFELCIRYITYICLSKIYFWRFIFFFCLEHIPIFHVLDSLCWFLWFEKTVLTEWSQVGDESCQSSRPELLVSSQAFVVFQAASLLGTPRSWGCQEQSVSQRGSHSVPSCELNGSWTLRQQLGMYVVKSLSGRNCFLCNRSRCRAARGTSLLNLWNGGPTGYKSRAYQVPIPWAAAAKAWIQTCVPAPSRKVLVTWSRLQGFSGRGVYPLTWSPGMIAPSPYVCAKLETWPSSSSFQITHMGFCSGKD